VSLPRAKKTIFGPLSKRNTGMAALRTGLPVKISILAILGAVSPHFKSDNGDIWHLKFEIAILGLPTHAKFCKNRL